MIKNTLISVLSGLKYRNCCIISVMKTDFKTNLRAELDYLGLTVKELSAKTGIPKGTLDCYLGARVSVPSADIAVKIAGAMDVTVEYLVTGREIKKQEKLLDHNIRSIHQILIELDEKEIETVLGLARILKSQINSGKTNSSYRYKKSVCVHGKESYGK
jgi:transcriptional regulator with XRE-family HTH domain